MKRLVNALFITAAIGVIVLVLSMDLAQAPGGNGQQEIELNVVSSGSNYGITELEEDLKQLASSNQDIELEVLDHSVTELPIYLARLGSGAQKVLVAGAFHGREWITSMLLVRMLKESTQRTELLSDFTFLFVPMINPDGVTISQQGLAAANTNTELLVRANEGEQDFTRWKANANGVNLNIQYEANWSEAVSEAGPHFEKYKGTRPESEPESKAIAELTRRENPEIVIAYHSSGEVIYWYYGQTGEQRSRDLSIAEAVSDATGYELAREERQDTHGGFKDWFIHKFEKPGLTIEVGDPVGDRDVPLNQWEDVWEQNKDVLQAVTQSLLE